MLFSSGADFVSSGVTEHIGQGHVSMFSASTSYPVPTAGTISDLRVKSPVGPGVPGSGETRTVTVHKSIGFKSENIVSFQGPMSFAAPMKKPVIPIAFLHALL